MDTKSIANRLVELGRTADFGKARNEMYASDAKSIEPEGSPWSSASGIEALNAKIFRRSGARAGIGRFGLQHKQRCPK